jgi:hypothetical protein
MEQKMSNTICATLALYVVLFAAACAPKVEDQVVYVDEPTLSVEPTYTGKYK